MTEQPKGHTPVIGGLGAMTVSARSAKALTGSGPQSLFGSFLVIQKGTRPAGRNPPNKKWERRRPSLPQASLLRAQRQSEALHKAFLPTFFSKKVG